MLIENVKRINHALDSVLLAASPLLLKVGLIMGTVSILTGGMLATYPAFQWLWAIVQAVGIDGLMLVVWLCFFRISSWKSKDKYLFGGLGLIYGGVAALVNNIVSFQDLHHGSLAVAMGALNVNLATFTSVRAVLIVVTTILYYPIEAKITTLLDAPLVAPIAPPITTTITEDAPTTPPNAPLPEQAATLHDQDAPTTTNQTVKDVALRELDDLINDVPPRAAPIMPTTPEGIKVVSAYDQLLWEGREDALIPTSKQVAERAGVSLTTAKKYLRQLKTQ